MSSIKVKPTQAVAVLADDLIVEINAEHEACAAAVKDAVNHAIRAGELLTTAKARCPHGTWKSWLAAHFRGSDRTARVYMQLASRAISLGRKRQHTAVLSVRGALQLIATENAAEEASEEDLEEEDWDVPLTAEGKAKLAALEAKYEASFRGPDAAFPTEFSFLPATLDGRFAYSCSFLTEDAIVFCEIFPSKRDPGYFFVDTLECVNGVGPYGNRTIRPMRWSDDVAGREGIGIFIVPHLREGCRLKGWTQTPIDDYEPPFEEVPETIEQAYRRMGMTKAADRAAAAGRK